MTSAAPQPNWLKLTLLNQRFRANVAALAKRYPQLAARLTALVPSQIYHLSTDNDRVVLGVAELGTIRALPAILTPASAQATVQSMFPDQHCKVSLIAGEDLGWLWNMLYNLPVSVPAAPGHRPPLFFLMRDLERLWVILHIQDWQVLLADQRVRLFAGENCVTDFRQSLLDEPRCPWPRLAVTILPDTWPAGVTFDSIFVESCAAQAQELAKLTGQIEMLSARKSAAEIAIRLANNLPIKILGITSRFTSFIQYSMRDWLASFERLGHTTRLEIEPADHLQANNLALSKTCLDFEPDLIVCIDHYRAKLSGIPRNIPMAMWVQDALPPLFTTKAGEEQGPLDFALGIAPLRMVHEFGYPQDRYLPAQVGVNEMRFKPVSGTDAKPFFCDVSYVSHASTTPEMFLQKTLQNHDSPHATRVITDIFNRLKGIYDAGSVVTEAVVIRSLIDKAIIETKTIVPEDQIPVLMHIFSAQINNAFFRHQPLQWLADAGVNLHLYGNGWEKHPTLSRYARGPADNQRQLADIYRGSKINLHASPHGGVHQRVMEILACGSLPMLRHCPGDVLEQLYPPVLQFCEARGITTDAELKQQATPQILNLLEQMEQILQCSPFAEPWPLAEAVRFAKTHGGIRSAGGIWGDDYNAISFRSSKELIEKTTRFLSDEAARQITIDSMRRPVMERFTYLAISTQLLGMVSENLLKNSVERAVAA